MVLPLKELEKFIQNDDNSATQPILLDLELFAVVQVFPLEVIWPPHTCRGL